MCLPYVATNVFDYQAPYTLTFRGYDLLAVTTLWTNGDGDTISGSEYVLKREPVPEMAYRTQGKRHVYIHMGRYVA